MMLERFESDDIPPTPTVTAAQQSYETETESENLGLGAIAAANDDSINPVRKRKLCEFEDDDEAAAPVQTDELVTYLSLRIPPTIDLLPWWLENQRLLPNMAKVARRLFCIPASSASSERAFSAAGITISDRRTSLDPETVDDILFLHSNA